MTRFFSFLLKSPEDYGESYGSYVGIWFEGAILIIIGSINFMFKIIWSITIKTILILCY